MKVPQTHPLKNNHQISDDPRITPEMRKAAEGLEAVFTQEIMKAMRGSVDQSEFSLKNTATDIYQGMLDEEYSDISARQNSLGLTQQILDYWLRSMPTPQYNNHKDPKSGSVQEAGRTGGTHEGQSIE